MKTLFSTLAAATLLSLAACAKHDDTTNTAGAEPSGNVEELGNDSASAPDNGFASENVIQPGGNATDAAATNAADLTNGSDNPH